MRAPSYSTVAINSVYLWEHVKLKDSVIIINIYARLFPYRISYAHDTYTIKHKFLFLLAFLFRRKHVDV